MAELGMKDGRWKPRKKGISHQLPEDHVTAPHPAFNKRARVGRTYISNVAPGIGQKARENSAQHDTSNETTAKKTKTTKSKKGG